MNRLLITHRENKILSALWDGNRVIEFSAEDLNSSIHVGDIYIGKVTSFVKNLAAAFVDVAPGVSLYLQMKEGEKVRTGEEMMVQVTREAVKTKMPVCSRQISLAGKYMVLTGDSSKISFSNKLTAEQRYRLNLEVRDSLESMGQGFIIRTNAGAANSAALLSEAERLCASYLHLIDVASHRPCYTMLRSGIPSYLTLIQDAPIGSIDEIVTDIPEIYQEILTYQEQQPQEDRYPVRLYSDPTYSMNALYRIEHYLDQARNKRVWLPSGGYLVIEPTEALTVVDVNTGKYDGKKTKEEAIRKIDLEAAVETARQLRLRNLSGIILVDFIDLKREEYKEELFRRFREELAKDSVKTVLVDITPLHLAEVTRKKVRGTLEEQLKS